MFVGAPCEDALGFIDIAAERGSNQVMLGE